MNLSLIPEKISPIGYHSPYYEVANEKIYSKYNAIKKCIEKNWEWPGFRIWSKSYQFHRPNCSFQDACKKQVEIISDTYKKVRLWYSGGRDSGQMLHSFLQNQGKIDEICVYRRFPGNKNSSVNEFDRFNVLENLKAQLKSYGCSAKVVIFDILPQHFEQYCVDLEHTYFPFSDIAIFGHSILVPYECYPQLQHTHDFVNVQGHAHPFVNNNKFCWVDLEFNGNFNDPMNINFFIDERNTDVAVHLAYAFRDSNKFGGREAEKIVKQSLQYHKNNTPLDDKWCFIERKRADVRWWQDRKDIILLADASSTDHGSKILGKFYEFYDYVEKMYSKFFTNGSIYNNWIGSVSESHTLIDN